MASAFAGLFTDYTFRTVALGAAMLGALGGALGTYAVLRKQSLVGDAVAHAALPGIALAYLFTGNKSLPVLLIGAALTGWVATLILDGLIGTTRLKQDTGLGMLLSVFFGFGLVLLTFIQKRPDAGQAGLDKFLFGQASALLAEDVWWIGILGAGVLAVVLLLWKEFQILTFDPDTAVALGFPVRRLSVLMTALLVIAIVVGLQTVGVILMSALVVAPAAAARQWTDRLSVMMALSALFGAVSGVAGATLSSSMKHMPTGPAVVMALACITVFSLLFAPKRGVLWRGFQRIRNRSRLRLQAVLSDLYSLSLQHADPEHGHEESTLAAMRLGTVGVAKSLGELSQRGWAGRHVDGRWFITQEGRTEAERSGERRGGDLP